MPEQVPGGHHDSPAPASAEQRQPRGPARCATGTEPARRPALPGADHTNQPEYETNSSPSATPAPARSRRPAANSSGHPAQLAEQRHEHRHQHDQHHGGVRLVRLEQRQRRDQGHGQRPPRGQQQPPGQVADRPEQRGAGDLQRAQRGRAVESPVSSEPPGDQMDHRRAGSRPGCPGRRAGYRPSAAAGRSRPRWRTAASRCRAARAGCRRRPARWSARRRRRRRSRVTSGQAAPARRPAIRLAPTTNRPSSTNRRSSPASPLT